MRKEEAHGENTAGLQQRETRKLTILQTLQAVENQSLEVVTQLTVERGAQILTCYIKVPFLEQVHLFIGSSTQNGKDGEFIGSQPLEGPTQHVDFGKNGVHGQ